MLNFANFTQPEPGSPALTMLAAMMSQVPSLTPADIEQMMPLWNRQVRLKRGDFLIGEGQTEQHLYFVVDGTMRIYLPTPDEDICVGFAYANTMVTSVPSFLGNKPSEYCIQALRQCELLAIGRTDWLNLTEQNDNFARFWRKEMERSVLGLIERQIDLLLPEPQQRLDRVRNRSPRLFQLIPKKYIASYLRMTPETLSRLR
ncbi:Crp/Fnr family transcriptional regulator [Hymenobacter busanensis]|uniref:Crp/Fnr family transcriptional regulator n=1 Tax=Hymenobacter busanensis TaxID=2607656 RepID=A0A7L4ZZM8_9BACT|nr:Crp/Fnr family transcriptional regulator [Hymenobacter busanensis]KAA9331335.1 Crp/Fnr family transcriptional regulator [Hymenobacter busanensis]QHJ08487.1 cyclic nucleotide-binding domain-containing protein [Hymenobacter busanensis]